MSAEVLPHDWSLWCETKPTVIQPLDGGLTNKNFLLAAGDKHYVLRINSPISEALNLDRATEAQVLRLADKAGLCAPLVYCDPGYQYLVTGHLAGDVWSADTVDGVSQLAQLLRRVHQLPPVDTKLDVARKAEHYWHSIHSFDANGFLSELKELDNRVTKHLKAAMSASQGICLCHNDLLKDNLIVTDADKLIAIDWEYAAMGDPFYDLAVIVEGHDFSSQQQRVLLSKYLGRDVNVEDWQRLYHWRIIYRYLTVLWYVVQYSTGAMSGLSVQENIIEQIQSLFELIAKGAESEI